MNLIERLRGMVQKIRRTPMPIADVVPMLQEAADEIERLAREKHEAQDCFDAAKEEIKRLTAELTTSRYWREQEVKDLTAELARAKEYHAAELADVVAERDSLQAQLTNIWK